MEVNIKGFLFTIKDIDDNKRFPNYRFVSPAGNVLNLGVDIMYRKSLYSKSSIGSRGKQIKIKINVVKTLAEILLPPPPLEMRNPIAYYLPLVTGKDREKLFKKDVNTFVLNKYTIGYYDGRLPAYTQQQMVDVIDMHKDGYTPQEIMLVTKLSNYLVLKIIDKYDYGY